MLHVTWWIMYRIARANGQGSIQGGEMLYPKSFTFTAPTPYIVALPFRNRHLLFYLLKPLTI